MIGYNKLTFRSEFNYAGLIAFAKIGEEIGVGAVGENFQGVENARAGAIEIGIAIDQINTRGSFPIRELLS